MWNIDYQSILQYNKHLAQGLEENIVLGREDLESKSRNDSLGANLITVFTVSPVASVFEMNLNKCLGSVELVAFIHCFES